MQKRVLFEAGLVCAVQDISQLVFASVSLVCPPALGLLSRCYPYATLSNLSFLDVEGYIAGVANPMFKQRSNWYDVCCDIETCNIILGEKEEKRQRGLPYSKCDAEFIRALIQRIKNREVSEEDVCNSFAEYTQILLDLSVGEKDYIFDKEEQASLGELHWKRIYALKKTKLFAIYAKFVQIKESYVRNGVSLRRVERGLRKLKFRSDISERELTIIYTNIFNYIDAISVRIDSSESEESFRGENDKGEIIQVLAYLPRYREGLHLIAIGLLSKSANIVKLTIGILKKIQTIKMGKEIFSNLNPFILGVYKEKDKNLDKIKK